LIRLWPGARLSRHGYRINHHVRAILPDSPYPSPFWRAHQGIPCSKVFQAPW
jgi:hypothetical protein